MQKSCFLNINNVDIDIDEGSPSGNRITQGTIIYDNFDQRAFDYPANIMPVHNKKISDNPCSL